MPKSATNLPWRLNQDYRKDRAAIKNDQVDDGVMQFDKAPSAAHAQAAE